MNSLLKAYAAALILAASIAAASAANVPSEIPLTIERLRAYALDHVNHVSAGVSGSTVQGNSWASSDYPAADGDPVAITAQVAKLQLSYSVLPNEKLRHMVSWDIKIGGNAYSAFFGAKDFTLVPAKGGDAPPADALNVELDLFMVPIPLPNVANAWFNYRDSSGNVTDSYVLTQSGYVHDGAIFLTPDMLRPNAELNVILNDGTRAIYGNDGGLLALDTISTSGLNGQDPSIRVEQNDATSIVCFDADQVIRVHYTKAVGTVNVSALSQGVLPDWIEAIEKSAFDADPFAAGPVWVRDKEGPPLAFTPKAGETWIILAHRTPTKG